MGNARLFHGVIMEKIGHVRKGRKIENAGVKGYRKRELLLEQIYEFLD